jgi:hypothetical protein
LVLPSIIWRSYLRSLLAAGLVAVATVLGTWAAGSVANAAPAHMTTHGFAAVAAASASPVTELSHPSCFHAGDCVAVGEHFSGGKTTPIAYHFSAGATTGIRLPSGGSQGFLNSVSCATGGCVAVGAYLHGSATSGFAQFFNGSSWSATANQPAGVSGASQVILESVSCLSSTDCVAAGFYVPSSNNSDERAIAEVWNGTTWRESTAPAQPYSNLDTISCVAPTATTTSCVLGGLYLTSAGDFVWAEHFDGSHWGAVSVPQPTTASAHVQFFNGMSCTSTTSCVGVGSSVNRSNHSSAFSEVLSGGRWSAKTITFQSGQQDSLNDVSCASASYCIAVGGNGAFTTLAGGKAAFAIWNGATWQLHVAPQPGTGHGNVLFGVGCVPASAPPYYCAAAGLEGTANTNSGEGLAGTVSNNTWAWKLVS